MGMGFTTCLLLGAVALALLAMLRGRISWPRPRSRVVSHRDFSPVVNAIGPRRCQVATAALADLAKSANSETITASWEELEGPLLAALPDCPPEHKPALAEALTECAQACANRHTAQSMMDLRNSLLEEPAPLPPEP